MKKLNNIYDIAIIGGGVIGSSIARELSKYVLKVCVLEKELDVCNETSGRNSGVLHAGFNNKPGSLMAKFCVEGNENFDKVAEELDIPFKRTGKLVVGFTEEDKEKLIQMKEQGETNGVKNLKIINREKDTYVGEINFEGDTGIVSLDDNKLKIKVQIPRDKSMNAVDGHKVVVRLGKRIDNSRFMGEVVEIIGHKNDPGIDILSIVKKYNIETDFPDDVK